MAQGTFILTDEEFELMIHLVAGMDPKQYKHPAARSLIDKCKIETADPHGWAKVVSTR